MINFQKIRTGAHSKDRISGGNPRFLPGKSVSDTGQTRRDHGSDFRSITDPLSTIQGDRVINRTLDLRVQHCPTGEISHETSSVGFHPISTPRKTPLSPSPSIISGQRPPSMVVAGQSMDERPTISTRPDTTDDVQQMRRRRAGA